MENLHDDYIVSYSVNLKEKSLVIQTYDRIEMKQRTIYFSEVLTHSFQCILAFSQILDLYECGIDSFVQDNQEELLEMKSYGWPMDYHMEQELTAFLNANEYRYIRIDSSYGMSGWILAKSYWLDE